MKEIKCKLCNNYCKQYCLFDYNVSIDGYYPYVLSKGFIKWGAKIVDGYVTNYSYNFNNTFAKVENIDVNFEKVI